jgi:replicative DNA helicase
MAGQKPTEREQYLELIHNPADLAAETVAWAEHILTTPGVPFGVEQVDAKMNPMHPGDLVVICGRPGHGKTSLLATMARAEAKRIVERGAQDEVVLYVTWEQVAEEINLILDVNPNYTAVEVMRGEVDLETIRRQSFKRVELPIWIIGDSISRTNTKSLRMFPDVVFKVIEQAVEEKGIKPTLMLFDYVQIIPARNVSEKVLQVSMAAELVKELAKRVGCPGVIGAQARRDVDDREWKVPTLRDPQWASAIEQVTDKFFGVWRPWLTDREKPPISIGAGSYPITENLFVLELGKQRFGEAGMRWALHFEPRDLRLCKIERDIEEPYGGRYQ